MQYARYELLRADMRGMRRRAIIAAGQNLANILYQAVGVNLSRTVCQTWPTSCSHHDVLLDEFHRSVKVHDSNHFSKAERIISE